MPPPLVHPPRVVIAGGGGRQEAVHSRLGVWLLLVPGLAHDDAAARPERTYELVRAQEIGVGCIVRRRKSYSDSPPSCSSLVYGSPSLFLLRLMDVGSTPATRDHLLDIFYKKVAPFVMIYA